MKLSRASSYALAYLAHLAREKPDEPVPSHEVARELDLPERFLLKVLDAAGEHGHPPLGQGAERRLQPGPAAEGHHPAGSRRGR